MNVESLKLKLRLRNFDSLKPKLAMRFLYDADEFYRFRGAETLGYLCKGQKAREYILRLFWHLSDESGAYCIGAPLGIAEIGRNNPKEFEGFKNRYVSLLENWEVERKYVAYGIGRTAEIVRDAYPNPIELLLEVLEKLKDDPNFVVYAVWALGMLKAEEVRLFIDDKRTAKFYNGEDIVEVRICDIAKSFTLKS
ncbi:DVU0298 family protein [Archaeoglobus sp.]